MKTGVAAILKRAAVAGAAAILCACTTAKAPEARVDAEALATAVKSSLAKDPQLASAASVKVNAKTGRVTLSGVVETSAERENAGRLACSAKGVKVVYNEIDVERAR
jgi:osmotically-inducible protein OsmY